MGSDGISEFTSLGSLVLGLLPVAMFGRVLIRHGAPAPRDRQPNRWEGWFPLRGRWLRRFFLGVQFVGMAPLIYYLSVILAIWPLILLELTLRSVVEAFGIR